MKNQKGITVTSLAIYIIAFVIIIGIVSSITVFFNGNAKDINKDSGTAAEYNKFNLYMLEYTKNGYRIYEISPENNEEQYITFEKNGKNDTFCKQGNILYFNEIKLCENVDEFKIEKGTAENGKEILKTYIQINGTVYTTNYVIE